MEQLLDLIASEPRSAAELKTRLHVSQPTISRWLKDAHDEVIRIGQGRSTRYARAKKVFGLAPVIPLFMANTQGYVEQAGDLRALSHGPYLVEAADAPFWLHGLAGTGLFDSLPYFLYDMRPAGFLGRQIARRLAASGGAPPDPRDWNDTHIGQYLVHQADDAPGNLIVGEAAANRANSRALRVIRQRSVEYPQLAELAINDQAPGSSAAGEQPKFAIYHEEAGHVLVKFSPMGQEVEAQRWRDLLRAEARALACLRQAGLPAVQSTFHDEGGRLFLESQRFDRCGERGRIPAISLRMIDAEFAGQGDGWARVGEALFQSNLLDAVSFEHLVWLETFGAWIGNTDMHLGNISLMPEGNRFRLLPVYDMLPMSLAPLRGEAPRISPHPPPIRTRLNQRVWESARAVAAAYWLALADDAALSDAFRAQSQAQGQVCEAAAPDRQS